MPGPGDQPSQFLKLDVQMTNLSNRKVGINTPGKAEADIHRIIRTCQQARTRQAASQKNCKLPALSTFNRRGKVHTKARHAERTKCRVRGSPRLHEIIKARTEETERRHTATDKNLAQRCGFRLQALNAHRPVSSRNIDRIHHYRRIRTEAGSDSRS